MSISVVDKISYTLFISSNDKISGTNNNATFYINWGSLFPNNHHDAYKVIFMFQTVGGQYKDNANFPIYFNSAKVVVNFGTKSYSLDSSNQCPSYTLGIIQRDIQSTTTNSNTLSCYYGYNPGKTISKPTGSNLNIQLINNYTYTYNTTFNPWVNNINYVVGATVVYTTAGAYYGDYYICTVANINNNPTVSANWVQYFPTTVNSAYSPLTDTTSAGIPTTDCTAWNIIMEFIPCDDKID